MTQADIPRTRPSQVFRVMLRGSLLPSALAGLLTAGVFLVVGGRPSGGSAALGLVVAVAFFASGFAVMARTVREASPMLFMAAALTVYLGQMIMLFLFFMLSTQIGWLDDVAVGVTILVVALVWQGASMLAWRRARVSVYDAAGTAGSGPTEAAPAPAEERS